MADVDPIASLNMWAVDVKLSGEVFEIPALPAATWFPILASGDLARILDLIEDPKLDDAIIDGAIQSEELSSALTDAVEAVAGRSWHVSLILVTMAMSNWTIIGGELARRGFRWDATPIGAALDALHLTIIEALTEDGRQRFQRLLDNTVLTAVGGRPNRDQAMSDFEAMAGPRPDTVRSTGEQSGSGHPRTPPQPQQHHQGDR
jgi:hypothetical protein